MAIRLSSAAVINIAGMILAGTSSYCFPNDAVQRNFIASRASVQSCVGCLTVQEVASAVKKNENAGSELEKFVFANAQHGIAAFEMEQTSDVAAFGTAVLLDADHMLINAHAFKALAREIKTRAGAAHIALSAAGIRDHIRRVVQKSAAINAKFARVVFPDHHGDDTRHRVQNEVVDVMICDEYVYGELTVRNAIHDLAIVRLRDSVDLSKNGYSIMIDRPMSGPVAVAGVGVTVHSDPSTVGMLRVFQLEGEVARLDGNEVFLLHQHGRGLDDGDSGALVMQNGRLVAVSVGALRDAGQFDDVYNLMLTATIEANMACLYRAYSELGSVKPNPFQTYSPR